MGLELTKEDILDDTEHFWNVNCKCTNGNSEQIHESYTFELAKTDTEMETIIVPDLTNKGYVNLSPVTWT